jgi:predicted RecB family nuclease
MGLNAAFHRDDGSRDEPGQDSSWDEWVAASRTFNFCSDDPLIDWLEVFGQSNGFVPDDVGAGYDPRTDFRRFLLERATEFERVVCDYLAQGHQFVSVRDAGRARTRAAVEATWEAMSAGVEIIGQAALWNPQNRTYGAPDLLVRSDVLHKLFPTDLPQAQAAVPAPELSRPDVHYRVVDIKFTTLDLLKDGHAGSDHLKYMVQVWLYNEALGRMQGFTPPSAFLLGRKWKDSKNRGTSTFDRIARIDHDRSLKGSAIDLRTYALSACAWIRRVRSMGGGWQVLPTPSVEELWPNIRRTDDQPWHQTKLQIARQIEDLTLLPRVTPEKRAQAVAAGLCRWTDPACTAAKLGITGEKNPAVVDAVIQANQSSGDGPFVFPDRVIANESLWRGPVAPEFYVDFETVSDLDEDFSRFPDASGQPLIFMIGCGHFSGPADHARWNFQVFTADSLSLAEERRVIDQWLAHLDLVCRHQGGSLDGARLFHWSPAETSNLTDAYNAAHVRQGSPTWPRLPWCDLLNRVVKEQPVTVRGAFGFGLKAIAKAMHGHGLIQTLWADGPADGLGAMVGAWWCRREADRMGVRLIDLDLMKEIEAYNEVDCRVMAEVLAYLRAHR